MRFFRWLCGLPAYWLLVVLFAVLSLAVLGGCIPVTIRPQFDDRGLPKATPVTLVGSQDLSTGEFHPVYPVSLAPPEPPASFPWESALQIAMAVLGVTGLGGAGVALRIAGKAKAALGIACQLADNLAVAETDGDVAAAKMHARLEQGAAGVRELTQKVRARGGK